MSIFKRRTNMFRDYARERRRKRTVLAALVFAGAVAVLSLFGHDPNARRDEVASREPLHELDTGSDSLGVMPASVDEGVPLVDRSAPLRDAAPERTVEEDTISPGDTAAALLGSFLSPSEIHDLSKACAEVYSLSRMRVGQPYTIVTMDGVLDRFQYEIDDESILVIRRVDGAYKVEREAIAYQKETKVVFGKITSSLYGAVAEASETPALAIRLADIFAWDIDFIRDLRVGDTFAAVVEKRFRDGQFAGYGKILAAEFVNQGEAYRGFLFPDKDGREQYYDEQGKSLRKAFLKAPLNFSRISSGFNLNRLHPVLGYRRPHPAIDYAAPSGTPVMTVGDGVVLQRGWDKGGGNFLKIRHNSVYETVYMHMKGYAKGIKQGSRVSQGQVIGYVGSTGMSTGPHLDFRMKVNGSYVNPATIKSPPNDPIARGRMGAFMELIQPFLAQLHNAGLMHAASIRHGADGQIDVALQ